MSRSWRIVCGVALLLIAYPTAGQNTPRPPWGGGKPISPSNPNIPNIRPGNPNFGPTQPSNPNGNNRPNGLDPKHFDQNGFPLDPLTGRSLDPSARDDRRNKNRGMTFGTGAARNQDNDVNSSRFFPRPGGQVPQTFSQVPVVVGTQRGAEWRQADSMIHNGRIDEARRVIDRQLEQNRSLENYMSAVATFDRADSGSNPYRQQALSMAREQSRQPGTSALPFAAIAKFSLEDQNDQDFRQATAALRERFPGDKHTYFFNGIQGLKDGNWKEAEESLRLAEKHGMPAEDIGQLLKLAIDSQKWVWEYAQWIGIAMIAWILGLAAMFVVGRILSACVLRTIQQASGAEVTLGRRLLRRTYRIVVNLAGLYYYLSLPMVTLTAIALPLAMGYAMLMLPYVSVPLVLVILVVGMGGVLTAISGIRAAFMRLHDEPPGRALTEAEAPEFWRMLREVANKVGTRPIDEVWLTPDATIAVVERGGYLKCWRDQGRRALILGIGALDGFRQESFAAVLAHEYGHFLNRDTAGGDVAMRVMAAMDAFAMRIAARGPIRSWHVAVQFLRLYHYLFRRLSFGASRLQEVLADRVAVLAYGAAAFQEGLKHVIRRAIEFQIVLDSNYRRHLRSEPTPANFYHRSAPFPLHDRLDIEGAMGHILSEPSTADDTHPSPRERFELAARLVSPPSHAEARPIWSLFLNRTILEEEVQQDVQRLMGEKAKDFQQMTQQIINHLTQAMRENPSPEGLFQRAEIYCEQGKFSNALADLETLLTKLPDAHVARLLRVRVLLDAERYGEATKDIDLLRAHLKGTEDIEFLVGAGRAYLLADRPKDAAEVLTSAVVRQKSSWTVRMLRGLAYHQLGSAEAERDFAEAVKLAPETSGFVAELRASSRPTSTLHDNLAAV